MVEKLKNIISKVEIEKGEVALFMLWKNLPYDTAWSVVVSADWIDSMNPALALNYWITKIRSELPQEDLKNISRVSFLKIEDASVKAIAQSLRVIDNPVRLVKTQVGNLFIEEALIFRSRMATVKKFLRGKDRNPIFNRNINPIFNHNINPIFNHNINPIFNRNINPIFNHNINPIFNRNINPIFNHNINPIFNHNINPIFNHNINPIFNHNINPIFNRDFDGYLIYDTTLKENGFAIHANDNILLIYNSDNDLQGIGVLNLISGFTIFDTNNRWVGTLVPNSQGGYVYYSDNNTHIGMVV